MDSTNRLAALRRRLVAEDIPAMIVTGVTNIRYMTGFENVIDDGINAACLVSADQAVFYTDHRYSGAAEAAADGTPWSVRVQKESLYSVLCADAKLAGIEQVTVESAVSYGRFKFISDEFSGAVRPTDSLIEELRQVKESGELERVAAAAALTDRAFDHILGFISAGKSERDVALELEFFMRKNGSDGVAFDFIVAGGPNSAHPHATVSDRILEPGDFLTMDIGSRVDSYRSDMTRTVVVGRASDRHRELYAAVLASNEAGIAAVRGGRPGVEIDAVSRDVLVKAGLGEYFTHSIGHGVGLDIHELPFMSQRSHDAVRTGTIVTIEPGVYIEGFGGVRIEDLMAVEEGGCRLLSHSPKQLIEL